MSEEFKDKTNRMFKDGEQAFMTRSDVVGRPCVVKDDLVQIVE
jgi:hypothetical protein